MRKIQTVVLYMYIPKRVLALHVVYHGNNWLFLDIDNSKKSKKTFIFYSVILDVLTTLLNIL